PGAFRETVGAFYWRRVPSVGCGWSNWSRRNGADADLLHCGEHAAPLSRRKGVGLNPQASGSVRTKILPRWWRFNVVGGIGVALQFALLFLLRSTFHFNYLAAAALAVE